MASSISHGLVLTTAMLFSTTVLYLVFSRQQQKPFQTADSPLSNQPILRSCLCSEEKKKEMKKKKKKRVKFAKNVMVMVVVKEEEEEIGEEQGKQKKNRASSISNCRNENPESRGNGMPANRIALYNGILRDRGHKVACCH